MKTVTLAPDVLRRVLALQRGEITEQIIYERLARVIPDAHNRRIIAQIAADEKRHYDFWATVTGREVRPDRIRVWAYYLVSRVLGITFGLKLLERGEENAQRLYGELVDAIPEVEAVVADEEKHEAELISLIDEERLKYVGSMVLGLNDALVELTGAMAGFTLALSNSRVIAAMGLITGIAASLSMAASEFQSTRAEGEADHSPVKASLYTGTAYVVTVILLIMPYLFFANSYVSLCVMMAVAMGVILFFTFYISVAQDLPFWRRFLEMAGVSFGVASLTFFIGWAVRILFNIQI
jgi:VIT1/CCC1 family predicted Fe2+/Mn2+ transporter